MIISEKFRKPLEDSNKYNDSVVFFLLTNNDYFFDTHKSLLFLVQTGNWIFDQKISDEIYDLFNEIIYVNYDAVKIKIDANSTKNRFLRISFKCCHTIEFVISIYI